MNYKDNIKYRKNILSKVYQKQKLNKTERAWLLSNPLYNEKYTVPILLRDVICVTPGQEYIVNILLKKSNYDKGKIIPMIGVAYGEGKIETYYSLFDTNGKETQKQETRLLGVDIDSDHTSNHFKFISNLGLMSIQYQCEYFDTNMNIVKRGCSDINLSFGMKKVQISQNKIEYHCKLPIDIYSDFDAFVFEIEINNK